MNSHPQQHAQQETRGGAGALPTRRVSDADQEKRPPSDDDAEMANNSDEEEEPDFESGLPHADEEDQEVPQAATSSAKGQTAITRFFAGKDGTTTPAGQRGHQNTMMGGQSASGGALSGKGNNQKQYVFKPKLHPKSLLKEGVSTLRYLADQSQSIFQIVMPWRQEQEDEERKRQKKLRHEAEVKQQSLFKWVKTKAKEGGEEKVISKEEEKYQQ